MSYDTDMFAPNQQRQSDGFAPGRHSHPSSGPRGLSGRADAVLLPELALRATGL